MNRQSSAAGSLAAVLCVAGWLLASGGCTTVATMMYLVKGNNIKPEFDGLKDRKVAVVCRPLVSLQYRNSRAARDVAAEVARLLRQHVRKIEVIDPGKVEQWTDENIWSEFSEVGEALGAEMVVGIDLESFSLFQGQTLYQGKADVRLTVVDCTQGNKVVFEKVVPQCVYPPNAAVPTSDRTESEFRQEFTRVLADYIGRHFYPHDAYADYAQDAVALQR